MDSLSRLRTASKEGGETHAVKAKDDRDEAGSEGPEAKQTGGK